jgi:hypothetical protein
MTSENQDDRDAKAKCPGFQFNFKKDVYPAPSNRTEPASGASLAAASIDDVTPTLGLSCRIGMIGDQLSFSIVYFELVVS